MSIKPDSLCGREKIFTSVKEINKDNILSVLKKAYAKHRQNVVEMNYLLAYERGEQPLQRAKTVRPEINIESNDNLANYIKEFKLGYFWGIPPALVQRGNNEFHGTNPETDSAGINALNEMLQNGINIGKKNLELAEFVEVCGIGHRLVDIKTDFNDSAIPRSYVELHTLDSRNAFCVYYAGVGKQKVLGVTYTKISGKNYYTAFTKDSRFEVHGEVVEETPNPLGMIPIIEYERAIDRTGCFERQIPLMDSLNIMLSDFSNDVAQHTQELWWANDVEFPVDPDTNEPVDPKSGEWVITKSFGNGTNQKIQPLSNNFDGNATLTAITNNRTKILQNAKVPIQYTSEGGGSTGVATDAMSGWSATEVDALRQERIIESGLREELDLILRAIQFVGNDILPNNSPIKEVHVSDVDFHFNRRKNYDMAVKANTFATLVSHGIYGRHALKMIDAFPDVEQVWRDSRQGIEEYQSSVYGDGNASTDGINSERIMSDNSDQISNSPIIGGMNTQRTAQNV